MAILRQTPWRDGDTASRDIEALFEKLLEHPNGCAICGAEQPDDVRWPSFAFELKDKEDGTSSGDFHFRTCPAHESQMDDILSRLGAA